jgi:hypothetical protein
VWVMGWAGWLMNNNVSGKGNVHIQKYCDITICYMMYTIDKIC